MLDIPILSVAFVNCRMMLIYHPRLSGADIKIFQIGGAVGDDPVAILEHDCTGA